MDTLTFSSRSREVYLCLFKHISSYDHPQVTGHSGDLEFFGRISDLTAMRLSPDFYRLSVWTCFKVTWTTFECLKSVVSCKFCNGISNCELILCWARVYSSCGWSFPRLQRRNDTPSAAAVTGVPRLSSSVHIISPLLSYWFFRDLKGWKSLGDGCRMMADGEDIPCHTLRCPCHFAS
jgi:hypothetical protein